MKTLLIAAIVSSIDQRARSIARGDFAPTRQVHDYRDARVKSVMTMSSVAIIRFHRQFRKLFRHEVSIRKSPPLVPNVREFEKCASTCIAGNGNICRESAVLIDVSKDTRRFVYEYLAMIRFLGPEMPFPYISLLALTIDNRDSLPSLLAGRIFSEECKSRVTSTRSFDARCMQLYALNI